MTCDKVTQNAFEIMMRNINNKSNISSSLSPLVLSQPIENDSKKADKNNEVNKNRSKNENENQHENENENKNENEDENENLPPPLSSLPLIKQKEWRNDLLNRICSTFPDLYK